ncbi:MAG: hypothetical protein HQK89_09675 [Nitrospirae bacterium]|nr:hypothetical protein [Nitrospirota bacterium]
MLQKTAKNAIIIHMTIAGANTVELAVKHTPASDDDSIFDDAEALIELAQKSFTKAAKKAIAENDALGIPSPGSVDGKIVFRMPPPKKATQTPR